MKRRYFFRLAMAPMIIPWVPTFTVTKAPIPEYDKEEWQSEAYPIPPIPEYDTLTICYDVTDKNGQDLCLWSKEMQKTFEAYGIFKSPSGKETTVKAELERSPTWLLTRVTATIDLTEKGKWLGQIKLCLPENQIHHSDQWEWEHRG